MPAAPAYPRRPSVGRKRIVFIGASYLFVHRVVRDLIVVGGFEDCVVVVHDLVPEPLKLVGDLIERMARQAGTRMTIERTLDRRVALAGADCVVLSINLGGPEADFRAFEACAGFGIPVCVGDTMGPTALARNLRMLPTVVAMVEDMERLCPAALFLNFTNPMSCVTGVAARRRSVRTFGLCHSADALIKYFATIFACAPDEVDLDVAGVNHQAFATRVRIRGADRTADVAAASAASSARIRDELHGTEDETDLQREVFGLLGAWPSTGGDHIVEFYPFFLDQRRIASLALHARKRLAPGRAPLGPRQPDPLLARWAYGPDGVGDMDVGITDEHAHEMMWSWFTGAAYSRSVNQLNDGAVPGLPDDACVEVMATIAGTKVIARPAALPTAALAWVQRWTAVHELSIRAALACDREAARQALMLDPHVRDLRDIDPLLDALLAAMRPWMPAAWYASAARVAVA